MNNTALMGQKVEETDLFKKVAWTQDLFFFRKRYFFKTHAIPKS